MHVNGPAGHLLTHSPLRSALPVLERKDCGPSTVTRTTMKGGARGAEGRESKRREWVGGLGGQRPEGNWPSCAVSQKEVV